MDLNKLYLNAPHSMGTTIICVTYNGGVVLGADSRTSTGCKGVVLRFNVGWVGVISKGKRISSSPREVVPFSLPGAT
ncbi:hypothetical protein CIPAW_15G028500 [Carya illinoinensis]|uniref:Uncharacterized protein n=1 Tax=Carya illinoinensis TaxID=32201 RepID=A0A8T1N9I3_CARIL|nr:hypothetical protein CIPAW_15G028500 [Carya illinoinensis]